MAKKEISLQVTHEFLNDLLNESERASVILSATLIDHDLERVLKKFLLPAATHSVDDLFGPEKPLGSFSAKTETAYRLGLISSTIRDSINLIRRIRNEVAHDIINNKLTQRKNSDRVNNLEEILKTEPIYTDIAAAFEQGFGTHRKSSVQRRFLGAVVCVHMYLLAISTHVSTVSRLACTIEVVTNPANPSRINVRVTKGKED